VMASGIFGESRNLRWEASREKPSRAMPREINKGDTDDKRHQYGR